MVKRWLIMSAMVFLVCLQGMAGAVEIKGVSIPDQAEMEEVDQTLVLNGAGIRKKFFINVYIGALYLPEKSGSARDILASDQPRRVSMHFLYSKVEAAKLHAAWLEGFEDNLAPEEFARLKPRIEKFNTFFGDAVEGDVILLDYIPDTGTRVTANGELKGVIPGGDFNRGLLAVWLGEEPVTDDLKEAMLGN